jgi:hypothetical protein
MRILPDSFINYVGGDSHCLRGKLPTLFARLQDLEGVRLQTTIGTYSQAKSNLLYYTMYIYPQIDRPNETGDMDVFSSSLRS